MTPMNINPLTEEEIKIKLDEFLEKAKADFQ